MWRGKVRIIGGTRRPDSGDEIEVRIARGLDGALAVDWDSGTDMFGQVRWLTIEPKHLDSASLCDALLNAAENVPAELLCESHGLPSCSWCFAGEPRFAKGGA